MKPKKKNSTRPVIRSVFKSQENNELITSISRNNHMFRTMNSKTQNKKSIQMKPGKISKKLFLNQESKKGKIPKLNNLDLKNLNKNIKSSNILRSSRSRTPTQQRYPIKTDRR
jgi:hypothetical protein